MRLSKLGVLLTLTITVASSIVVHATLVILHSSHAYKRQSAGEPHMISGAITIQRKPAAGVSVELQAEHSEEKWDAIANTSTDKYGRFQFAALADGQYWVKVNLPGYMMPDEPNSNWDSDDGIGALIEIHNGSFPRELNFDLTPSGVISGRITDADGRPVAHQEVRAVGLRQPGNVVWMYCSTRSDPDEPIETDESGQYKIVDLPPGKYQVSVGENLDQLGGASRSLLVHPGREFPVSSPGLVSSNVYYH